MTRIAVIGGGASGVMTACLLRTLPSMEESKGMEVHLFEQGEEMLRKLRATGNGRCNFTNAHVDPSHYTGEQSTFVQSVLQAYTFSDARSEFERLGIPSITLESGMTYPATLRADTVVETFLRWLKSAKVVIHTRAKVTMMTREEMRQERKNLFCLHTATQDYPHFDRVILATGGSYGIEKKEWSNGYSLVKLFGHPITPLHSGIVSLCAEEVKRCASLKGIRVKARVTWREESVVDDLLFTEYGLSGMAILRLSNRILDAIQENGESELILVDLLPLFTEEKVLSIGAATVAAFPDWQPVEVLSGMVPQVIAQTLVEEWEKEGSAPFPFHGDPVQEASIPMLLSLLRRAKHWAFHLTGSRRKDHGQITCGGIDVREVSEKTLESRRVPGLYFTGEVLDVQGECGGYNLHWAFASAHAVARDILQNRV